MTEDQLAIIEESAFYESGLSAHGCLENLDSYTREAIKKYGRYLLQNQKEINDYTNGVFSLDGKPTQLKCQTIPFVERIVHKAASLEIENEILEKRLKDIKEGFEGCCYACEPVGILNKKLEEQLKAIEEDGTEEHNNAVELRMKLAETLVQNDELKKLARKLYGIAIHLQAISSDKPVAVIGNSFYQELVDAIKEYEELHV
jgi:hypothetical protein